MYYPCNKKYLVFYIILCFLYACSDEFHQTFIGGRSPRMLDVMIDTIGSIVGLISIYLIERKK